MNSLDDILYQVTRPGRYTGGEWNSVVKEWDRTPVRIALAFPDIYEIGMSNLAIQILYDILNQQPDILAERVYAPWVDMERQLREHSIPLYSLESKRPLCDFDIVGFSLGYELTYTSVLNMLDLGKIPLLSHQRDGSHPLVIAGGSCALNPEPMSDFIDLFVIGEAEESILTLLATYRQYKGDRDRLLREAAKLPGVYVPGLYDVSYDENGVFAGITPKVPEAKTTIERQLVATLPKPVTRPVVPYVEVVFDRGAIELQRGCTRGCRFCQAGMIYRPVRERPQQEVIDGIDEMIRNCGYSEVSLLSLSTGDYGEIRGLLSRLEAAYKKSHLTISLPSLRLDALSISLIESLPQQKKVTLTFAPEAGTERLRRVINKVISEDTILETFNIAFDRGWTNIKLYFMIGLPTETMDDIQGIVELVSKISKLGRQKRNRPPRIRVSASTLVPKPHSPCQWFAQHGEEQLLPKQQLLRQGLKKTGAHFSWHEPKVSKLEAALSRGDRRLGRVIYRAWESGCRLDTWDECFDYQKWVDAFESNGLDPAFYANREISLHEPLPWQHIDTGVTTAYLQKEYQNMWKELETPDCRFESCSGCGLQRWHIGCQHATENTGA
jgi:radical SAM family uncharacterized protein